MLILDEMRIGGGTTPTTPPARGDLALHRPAMAPSTDSAERPAADAFDRATGWGYSLWEFGVHPSWPPARHSTRERPHPAAVPSLCVAGGRAPGAAQG